MAITVKQLETDDEIRGKSYVHWKAWHEAYPGLVSADYLDRFTLERAEKMAFSWPDNSIVAKDGERVVGFVSWGVRDETPDTGEIFALYVLSEYYGTGVGGLLLDAGLEQLSGYPQLALWVLKDNARAIRFYEKHGFVADGQEMESPNIEATEIRMVLKRVDDLRLYIPRFEDGWFYVQMMSDPKTMSYNAPWFPPDGCIPDAEAEWKNLHASWIGNEQERFYAYLQRVSDGAFVGDVNYHYDPEYDRYDMGIVVYAPERGKGYGKQGLRLLIDRAFRVNGISCLHNDFETTRDAAYRIHKDVGFREVTIEGGCVQLEMTLNDYLTNY